MTNIITYFTLSVLWVVCLLFDKIKLFILFFTLWLILFVYLKW